MRRYIFLRCGFFFLFVSAGSTQAAITILDFSRTYITFNYKGDGNAQIFFQETEDKDDEKAFTVCIDFLEELLFALRKHAYSNILKALQQQKKRENFQIKYSDIFHIPAQDIDCEYSLEPPRRGDSNEYPQSMFVLSK